MRCDDVTEQLLLPDSAVAPELERHLASCAPCAHVARAVGRLNTVLTTSLVIEPPLELQQRLAALALGAARPTIEPARSAWWSRLFSGELNMANWLVLRPNVIAAQGLAAVMLALASWQVFGWLSMFKPVVGDVAYAMTLVAASPAVVYLGGLQVDLQSLGVWSLVGLGGWLLSDTGLIGRRLSTRALP